MADIPHVTAGDKALAAEQNAFIDQCNGHTDDIAAHDTRITDLESEVRAACILRKSVNQTTSSSAGDELVTWDVTERDTASMKSGDSIIIQEAGTYLVVAQANMEGGGTVGGMDTDGERVLYVTHNGSSDVFADSIAALSQPGVTATGGVGNGLMTGSSRYLAQADELRVYVWQRSGADLDLRASAFGGCTFSVTKVG